ncbi:hypothetical protein D047_4610A, partial [Vibrio parahaemolyticus VPTS-2010_2]
MSCLSEIFIALCFV